MPPKILHGWGNYTYFGSGRVNKTDAPKPNVILDVSISHLQVRQIARSPCFPPHLTLFFYWWSAIEAWRKVFLDPYKITTRLRRGGDLPIWLCA